MGKKASSERTARVGAGEVLGAKTSGVEQRYRERIAKRECGGLLAVGARLWGQASCTT